jgi:hypothetical protein
MRLLELNSELFRSLAALAIFASLGGCTGGEPVRVPVAGRVTIDGEAVTGGTIRFVPKQGRPVSSAILADGSFDLASSSISDKIDERGVYPGTYRIAVSASELLDEDSIRWHAPKEYADFRTSGLVKTIDKPIDDLSIELTWKDSEEENPESVTDNSDSIENSDVRNESDESGTESSDSVLSQQ